MTRAMLIAMFLVAGCATPQNEAYRIPKEDGQTAMLESEQADRGVAQENQDESAGKPTVLPKKKTSSKKQ